MRSIFLDLTALKGDVEGKYFLILFYSVRGKTKGFVHGRQVLHRVTWPAKKHINDLTKKPSYKSHVECWAVSSATKTVNGIVGAKEVLAVSGIDF